MFSKRLLTAIFTLFLPSKYRTRWIAIGAIVSSLVDLNDIGLFAATASENHVKVWRRYTECVLETMYVDQMSKKLALASSLSLPFSVCSSM